MSSLSSDSAHTKVEHVSFDTEDGAVIYADVYGEGDRGGVLARGGRFRKESWQPEAELLVSAGYRILAFDFRGFGKSHGPGESDIFTAPVHLDVLTAVHYHSKEWRENVGLPTVGKSLLAPQIRNFTIDRGCFS